MKLVNNNIINMDEQNTNDIMQYLNFTLEATLCYLIPTRHAITMSLRQFYFILFFLIFIPKTFIVDIYQYS